MASLVKLIECPRDAWQGLKGQIPAPVKADYLRALIDSGFKNIDAVSFVSPKAVPQMADSEEVLDLLGPVADDVEIIAIVVNEKGVERAIAAEQVSTIGFPYSISPTFLEKNQNQTPEQALDTIEKIKEMADDTGLETVVYISMAFGNPYGDVWSAEEVLEAVDLMEKTSVRSISLADTVGVATAEQIAALVRPVIGTFVLHDIGVHLHSRPDQALDKVLAAYDAGCRRFDSAIGGLGGCPLAQDLLVGNIPTERVLDAMRLRNAAVPSLNSVSALARKSAEIARYGDATKVQ
jgi:hydroxymethylglutaryl-CoA lyase